MSHPRWEFDDGALHNTIKRTKTYPSESLAVPERAYDRGRSVSFSDVGGLLRDEVSPGRGRRSGGSGGSDSACGSASGSASGSESYDSVVMKAPPDDMMFNDVGGLLTVFEEV